MSTLPLPLVALKGAHIVDQNGWTVAQCHGDYAEEYARLIVTAVNSHDRLLAAAKGIQRLSKLPFPPDAVDVGSVYEAIAAAREIAP